jgi:hypothetical protein
MTKEFVFNVMKKFKLLQENGFENSLKFYMEGFEKLVYHWQHRIELEGPCVQNLDIAIAHSELYFCFVS